MKFVIELNLDNEVYRRAGGAFPAVVAMLKSMQESGQLAPSTDFPGLLNARSDEKFIVLLEATSPDVAVPEDNVQARVVITRDTFDRTFYTERQSKKYDTESLTSVSQFEVSGIPG